MFKIDLSYLETIAGGDQSFITEMLTMLLNSTFNEMENMKILAAEGKWNELSGVAHKIKAPIQMLGVKEISDLILEVETLGKKQIQTEEIPAKVASLDTCMAELKQQVEQLVNKK
jgi:HPt (histidine-containing phosphotransfer) domain-containing protein